MRLDRELDMTDIEHKTPSPTVPAIGVNYLESKYTQRTPRTHVPLDPSTIIYLSIGYKTLL